jgi:hypothetical protein
MVPVVIRLIISIRLVLSVGHVISIRPVLIMGLVIFIGPWLGPPTIVVHVPCIVNPAQHGDRQAAGPHVNEGYSCR